MIAAIDGAGIGDPGPLGLAFAAVRCFRCRDPTDRHRSLLSASGAPAEHCLDCIEKGGPCA
jgi:hypothetical protein